jgi:hypothetical protein
LFFSFLLFKICSEATEAVRPEFFQLLDVSLHLLHGFELGEAQPLATVGMLFFDADEFAVLQYFDVLRNSGAGNIETLRNSVHVGGLLGKHQQDFPAGRVGDGFENIVHCLAR